MIKLLVIDGLNLLRRIYSALPTIEGDTPDIERFIKACDNAFKHIMQQHQPSHAVCVLEHYRQTWRHRLYPPYKANRKPQPAAMLDCFPRIRKQLEQTGISWLDIEGYEADDIIASIVHTTRQLEGQKLILSTDHLMAQLLDKHTHLYDHFAQHPIDQARIAKRFAILPQQLPDYFALVGSGSVNIPGITGIGAKTAAKLLAQYENCDTLLKASDCEPQIATKIEDKAAELYLYRGLFELRKDCPIHANLKDWRVIRSAD